MKSNHLIKLKSLPKILTCSTGQSSGLSFGLTFGLSLVFILAFKDQAAATTITFTANVKEARVYEVDLSKEFERKTVGVVPVKIQVTPETNKLYVIEKSGYTPVYIPVQNLSKDTIYDFNLRKTIDWTPDELSRKITSTAEEVVDEILAIQALLDQRITMEALYKAEVMKDRYPNSVFVALVYANALFLSGNREKAKAIYYTILEQIPESKKNLREQVESVRDRLTGKPQTRSISSQRKARAQKKGKN